MPTTFEQADKQRQLLIPGALPLDNAVPASNSVQVDSNVPEVLSAIASESDATSPGDGR